MKAWLSESGNRRNSCFIIPVVPPSVQYVRYCQRSTHVQDTAAHIFTVCRCLDATTLCQHILQVSDFLLLVMLFFAVCQCKSKARKQKTTFHLKYCRSEFSQLRNKKSSYSPLAVIYLLYAVLMETNHVLWQAHSFVLPISVSWSIFSVYRHCPQHASSSSDKKATLKRCLDVAASLHRCYFGGYSSCSVIIQWCTSVYSTGVRCKPYWLIVH